MFHIYPCTTGEGDIMPKNNITKKHQGLIYIIHHHQGCYNPGLKNTTRTGKWPAFISIKLCKYFSICILFSKEYFSIKTFFPDIGILNLIFIMIIPILRQNLYTETAPRILDSAEMEFSIWEKSLEP